MDSPRERFGVEQSIKRGRDRPRRTVRESQPSGKFSSTPPFDERMEGILKPARPSTHVRRPSISDWVGVITQSVVVVVAPSASFHAGRLEAAKLVEIARRLGAQEFLGTIDLV